VRFSCFPTQSLHSHLVEVVPHGLWKTTWNFRTCWKSGIHNVLSTETTVLLMPNFRTAISSCVKLKNCFKLLTFWELASHKPKKTILGLFAWLVSFCQDNEQKFSLSSGIDFTWVRNKISITFRTPGQSIKLHSHLNTGINSREFNSLTVFNSGLRTWVVSKKRDRTYTCAGMFHGHKES
jgi:hypothetical protein